MTRPVYVEDPRGARRIDEEQFPLSLGGSGSDIELAGAVGDEPLAWLGRSDDDVFVQVAAPEVPVLCNGAPVESSQWLRDGDVIRVARSRIGVLSDAEGIRLRVAAEDAEPATEPPLITADADSTATEITESTTIRPVEFKPQRSAVVAARRRRIRPAVWISWAVLLLLAVGVWFVFTLRSIDVRIDPAPDAVTLRGNLPALELGERYLLRPGTYRVRASKEGYYPLETSIDVTQESNQIFELGMKLRPGTLQIEGNVAGARVLIDGTPAGQLPLEPIELERGEHRVGVSADRHTEFATDLIIDGGGVEQTLEVELLPLWAEIKFRSDPSGAAVRVGGQRIGQTPLTAELLEGTHLVEVRRDGYKAYRGSVDVVAREPQELPTVRLVLSDGKLVLTSAPGGATVTVDGTYRGLTPIDLVLSPNRTHEVELTKTGHEPVVREVSLRPGETDEMDVSLSGRLGQVEVVAYPPDAELIIDGRAVGAARQIVELTAVPHQVEVRKNGYEPYRTTITPRPGFPQSIDVELKTAQQIEEETTPDVLRSPQGQELVLLRGGRMTMGAPRREPGRRANETEREIELSRPFYLATTEVTNRQFREFRKKHLSGRAGPYNLEFDHHPAVRISWDDAAEFCNWLSAKDSLPPAYVKQGNRYVAVTPLSTGYRLPTEAEWAWAARFGAGKPLKYPWGDSLPVPAGAGNYADGSAADLLTQHIGGYDDGFPSTAPAGSFEPNALGIFNLGDNVAEWIHDLYTIYSPESGTIDEDPAGPEDGELHVIRGAGWMDSNVSELRLTFRDHGREGRPDLGFRIARYAK